MLQRIKIRTLLRDVCLLSLFIPMAGWSKDPPASEGPTPTGGSFVESKRFPAIEAKQGVAVDKDHFYVIDNKKIGKYSKESGERLLQWEYKGKDDIVHFNAGMVHEGKLYLAHSNFPKFPPSSSVEIFDVAGLKPVASHSFGIADGSLTWVDRHDGKWIACFVNYNSASFKAIGRNSSWSQVIEFDDEWRRLRAWTFPDALIKAFHEHGASGGTFGADGRLYVTGHDAREVYVLEFPTMGSRLRWVDTLPIATAGQAIDWDDHAPSNPPKIYSIERKTGEVVVSELKP